MRSAKEVIAEAVKRKLRYGVAYVADDVVAALRTAGYEIVRRRENGDGASVDRGPKPRPTMTNVIAGDQPRRGVFEKA